MANIDPKKIIEGIKPSELKKILMHRSPNKEIVLYLSLGHLKSMYMAQAEHMMKERGGREALHFTNKAKTVEEITKRIFGRTPEKNYYTGGYSVPDDWNPETDPEEAEELAQFCVSNMPQVPQINTGEARQIIKEKIREHRKKRKTRGITVNFINQIKKATEEWYDPNKVTILLEVTLLFQNIEQVLQALEKQEQQKKLEQEQEQDIEQEQEEKEELPGFKV